MFWQSSVRICGEDMYSVDALAFSPDNRRVPSMQPVVHQCEYCSEDVVWLETVYGGNRLFDARMYPVSESDLGNRFAIRRSRKVMSLDDIQPSHWPKECLHLHMYSCSEYHEDTKARIWTVSKAPGRRSP